MPDSAPAGDFDPSNLLDYWSSDSSEDGGAKSGNESGAESDGDQVWLMLGQVLAEGCRHRG